MNDFKKADAFEKNEDSGHLKQIELKKRLGTLSHVKVTENNKAVFLESLLEIKDDLEECYGRLHRFQAGSDVEAETLKRITVLEETRFEMLHKINGQKIEGYTQHPVDIA